MPIAEKYAFPTHAEIGTSIPRTNDFKEVFYVRWGRIHFAAFGGDDLNVKAVLNVYRSDDVCERFIIDTDWNNWKRATRDFYIHPFSVKLGHVRRITFSFIVHTQNRSIPSEHEYRFIEGATYRFISSTIAGASGGKGRSPTITAPGSSTRRNCSGTWTGANHHFESLNLTPKFTKGQPYHPFHPRPYIHDRIDATIRRQQQRRDRQLKIKVCVDCIDDTDFTNHLIHAHWSGVKVECIVDWRKMTLTNSDSYARLKRSGIDLLGDFCTPKDPMIEVAPDMHNKFIFSATMTSLSVRSTSPSTGGGPIGSPAMASSLRAASAVCSIIFFRACAAA